MSEEYVLHTSECQCIHCLRWFGWLRQASVTGLCGCGRAIDDHPKGPTGQITGCPPPKQVTA